MLVSNTRTKLILGENDMEVFTEYLAKIDNPQHRARTEEVLAWVTKKFPNLDAENCVESAYVYRSWHIYYWL